MKTEDISWIVLACVSVYCIGVFGKSGATTQPAYISFLLSAIYAIAGVVFLFIDENSRVASIIGYLQRVLTAPGIASELWLRYEFLNRELAYVQFLIPVVMCILYLAGRQVDDKVETIAMGSSAASIAVVGFVNKKFMAIGAAICFYAGYFIGLKDGNCGNISCRAYYNLASAAFLGCSLFAL